MTCQVNSPSICTESDARRELASKDGMQSPIDLLPSTECVQSSVTLVGEADRKMLKAAIKRGAGEDQVRHRIVPSEAIAKWTTKLDSLKSEIAEIMKEEREEKQVRRPHLSMVVYA